MTNSFLSTTYLWTPDCFFWWLVERQCSNSAECGPEKNKLARRPRPGWLCARSLPFSG